MLKAQSGPGGRRPANGGPGAAGRPPAGRNRSVKPPLHTAPQVFEGIYNNARMTHFLTAVVGSTCDVRVKNGSVFEGIFKTLSSRCELAVDAVHKCCEGDGSMAPPRREEITETMIFSPADIITMTCRDVDLNYATRDTFTDVSISTGRVNGEHKEKVLQRWDGGDTNGDNFDLEADTSNGWDANEMFRFNEETYGVKSTYDSTLSMYTTPLERSSSDGFKQREARAAKLANEIEASVQYRHRVSLENDEGRSEEEKYSAVVRDGGERESPRERGRDSPSNTNREGKYIPLPQRVRDMGGPGGGGRDRGGRVGGGFTPSRPAPASSAPRPPASSPGPQSSPSERSSPLTSRTAFSPNTHSNVPSPRPSESGGSPSSPTTPMTHTHSAVPHSHSLPHSLSDAARPVNGVSSKMSPKAHRLIQSNRSTRTATAHPSTTASRSPKSDTPSQDSSNPGTPYIEAMPVSMAKQKSSGPTPLFPIDVNEILSSAGKDKSVESPSITEEAKSKAPSAQQRSQIEELRKFGKEFRLQPSSSSASALASAADPSSAPQPGSIKPALEPLSPAAAEPKPSLSPNITPRLSPNLTQSMTPSLTPSPQLQPPTSSTPAEDHSKEKETPMIPIGILPLSDRQSAGTPQPARTPGMEESRTEPAVEGVTDQVKKSTLNPNAKEFNPNKPPLVLAKPSTAPTPPRPAPASPSVVLHQQGQNPIYNTQYLSYVSPIHSVQAPQMYQYTMSAVNQGKYPRPPKGSVVTRSDHGSTTPAMLQAAASAAGASLVPSPYPQPYLQYNPQQYGQQQVIQTMTPYGQPMYSVLQSSARMLGQSGGHPQTLGPPAGSQFPGQTEGPQGPQQGLYAPQSFAHHSGSVHPPQPSSTPTGNQPPPQHTTPSPGQTPQAGPQSLYHSAPLSAPTPPNLPPGHSSPQTSYPLQGYSLHGHQPITHTYPNLGQLAQAHVPGPMSGPHHSGNHGPPQVVMLHAPPPQAGPGSAPQHPQHSPQQGPPHFAYIGHPTAVQVQPHPSQQMPFHPPGN